MRRWKRTYSWRAAGQEVAMVALFRHRSFSSGLTDGGASHHVGRPMDVQVLVEYSLSIPCLCLDFNINVHIYDLGTCR